MTKQSVTVIIPALDEEQALADLLPKLVELYPAIVVDNGSNDSTSKVAKKMGAMVLPCPIKGYGRAVKTAIDFLCRPGQQDERPDIIVVMDADGTSSVENIETLIEPILSGEKDFTLGQRKRTLQEKNAMPFHAKFGNDLQVYLINKMTGYQYTDMGPLRAIRLNAIESLDMQDKTWGWNVEMQIKAAKLALRIQQFDIRYSRRKFGKSKISGSFIGSVKAASKILYTIFYYYIEAQRLALRRSPFVSSQITKESKVFIPDMIGNQE